MLPKNISANRWHNATSHSAHDLAQRYGLPSAWLRRSAQSTETAVLDDLGVKFQYMRAAAVFPLHTPITPLTVVPTWSVVCKPARKAYRIVLVSVVDAEAWIQRAYEAGAEAWWLCDPGPLYRYEPIVHPDPRTASLEDVAQDRGAGEYDRDALMQDLARGTQTQAALAAKYGITRSMVSQVNKMRKASLITRPRRQRGPRTEPLNPEQEAVIIQDIQAGTMTKLMIAERHQVAVNRVGLLILKYNLKGLLPRGGNAKKLSPKYREKQAD
jgi:transposase